MPLFVSPVRAHGPLEPRPPGITGGLWCYMVSTVDLAELEAAAVAVGALAENVRTPALGANVTYLALDGVQRAAAITAGALPAPTEGTCRGRSFDRPVSGGWEP